MKKTITFGIGLLLSAQAFSQHSNESYNDGALIHVESGAEVHVLGDVHLKKATAIQKFKFEFEHSQFHKSKKE
ncbi:hypothetical protein OAU25_01070 [Crocinitomicaceae bacterium]|nr:hypothetical protein [Crocinitomicaceae bacterium]